MHQITWDIDRVFIYVPFLDFPIYWYGLFFALGIYLSQKWLLKLIEKEHLITKQEAQNLIFALVISIVIGARLFDILFYQDLKYFMKHPLDALNLRAGGLSSHGGFIGFLVGLAWQTKRYKISFFKILAMISIPTGLLAFFIRIGNLFNQEILGKPTSGPFSIVFTKPLEPLDIVPRHPVMIYEALIYLATAFMLSKLKINDQKKIGLALVCYFGSRALLEPLKLEQSVYDLPVGLTMGMLLSIPIVVIGCYLLLKPNKLSTDISHT